MHYLLHVKGPTLGEARLPDGRFDAVAASEPVIPKDRQGEVEMKNKSAAARLISLLVMGMALSGSSFAGYIFSALAPVSGGYGSYAFGIKNSGQVVGQTQLMIGCCSRTHATIRNEGVASEGKA